MDDLPDHTTQNKDSNMKKKKRKEKRKEKRKGSLSQKETRQCHRMKLRSKVTQNVGLRCRGTRRMQEESNYDVDSNANEEDEGEALREERTQRMKKRLQLQIYYMVTFPFQKRKKVHSAMKI